MKKIGKFLPKEIKIFHLFISFIFTTILVALGLSILLIIGQDISADKITTNWLLIFALSLVLFLTIVILNNRRKAYLKENFIVTSNSFIYIKYIFILVFSVIIFFPLGYNIKYSIFEEEPLSEADIFVNELIETFNDTNYTELDTSPAGQIKSLTRFLSDKWYKVESQKGNFSIEFPMYHVEEKKHIEIVNNERIEVFYFKLNSNTGIDSNLGYQVSFFKTKEISSINDLNSFYNDHRDYLLYAMNASIIQEIEIDTFEYPARQLICELISTDLRIIAQFRYFEGYFYKLAVITTKDDQFNNTIYRFFNSFKIIT